MKPIWVWAYLCLLLLNATIHFSQSSQNTETNGKDSNIVLKKVKEGEKLTWLICHNANTSEVSWRKNGNLVPSKQIQYKTNNSYGLPCVTKLDEGNYTCHDTSEEGEVPLKKFVLKVLEMTSEEEKNRLCGKQNKAALVEKFWSCPKIPAEEISCCKRFAPAPENVSLSKHFNKSYDVCKLYGSQDQPWMINVNWKVPFYAHHDIWGWQIFLLGLRGDTNFQRCVQINSKDTLLNWIFSDVLPGATYAITVESLPSGYGFLGYKPNFGRKEISIPSLKEMCKTKGRKCKWQICIPVKNVTVTRQNTEAQVVSWRRSEFYKSPHVFLVLYRGQNCKDSGTKLVKNSTQVILNVTKCHAYFVRILPIFSDFEFGTYSEEVLFYTGSLPIPHNPEYKPSVSNVLKMVISSSIAISILLPVLIILLCIYKRKRKVDSLPTPPDPVAGVKVFIGYNYNHCRHCNDVAHFLGKVLQSTGEIECSLDIWTTEKIEMGCKWYEQELENCDIILFICAVKDQKISNEFALVETIIKGKEFWGKNVPLVTIGFDNHLDNEIPPSLKYRAHFKLPSQIDDLCFNINPGDCSNIHDYKNNFHMGHTVGNIDKLENAIERAESSHRKGKMPKATCVRYFPEASTSRNEFR